MRAAEDLKREQSSDKRQEKKLNKIDKKIENALQRGAPEIPLPLGGGMVSPELLSDLQPRVPPGVKLEADYRYEGAGDNRPIIKINIDQ